MSVVRPKRSLHRGSVRASGVCLNTRLIGESEARARILDLGLVGLDVFRLGERLVVLFRDPIRIDCAESIGAPLVRQGNLWSEVTLDESEAAHLDDAHHSVVTLAGGVANVFRLDVATREDVAPWIDGAMFTAVPIVHSLGESAAAPAANVVPVGSDVRRPLGAGELASGGSLLLESLTNRADKSIGTARSVRSVTSISPLVSFVARAASVLGSIFAFLRFPRSRSSNEHRGDNNSTPDPAVTKHTIQPWTSKIGALFQRAIAHLLVTSRLAALVGRAHAKYLSRLLEMLEGGDLDTALRHAIPLSKELETALAPPALGTPSPRTELSIVPHSTQATSSYGFGPDLFSLLTDRYRRLFDRLVSLGEIEKAAFVLAELLNANEEAVSFLERHGRYKLAAEIAEARKLAPGLVVRQWFLAGDRKRAIAIARRTGAFADAVTRLERSHVNEARSLRLLWADTLSDAGAYAAAVDVVWPLVEARPLALEWIDRAIAIGGVTGARMLVRKARAAPERLSDVRPHLLELTSAEGDEARAAVVAAGRELLLESQNGATRILSKIVARALVVDRRDADDERLVKRLLDVAGDAVFRADFSACAKRGLERPREIRIDAYATTRVGSSRDSNEDACVAMFLGDNASVQDAHALSGDASRRPMLLGAFDGSGRMSASESAGESARRHVAVSLARLHKPGATDVDRAASEIAAAIRHANREFVLEAASRGRKGLSCAVTIATIVNQTLLVAQIGNTRASVFRDGKLVQVTKEHSLLNAYIDAGEVGTAAEIANLDASNVITRVLGMTDDVSPDMTRVELCRGDVVLVCSDGLWNLVYDVGIRRTLEQSSPAKAANTLVSLALAAGGNDNIAVVVAHMSGVGLPVCSPSNAPVHYQMLRASTLVKSDALASESPMLGVDVRPPLDSPVTITRGADDIGALAVYDAAELPDGRLLVALGEIGVWVLARDGKVQQRFSAPAHHLVVSDHGDRAILLAPRGESYQVARLNVQTKRVESWCDAKISAFAPNFDGAIWYVAQDDAVFAIDALSTEWEHLWTTSFDARRVGAISRDAESLSVVVGRTAREVGDPREALSTEGQVWTFGASSHVLRQRGDVSSDAKPTSIASSAGGYDLRATDPWGDVAVSPRGRIAAWRWRTRNAPSEESSVETASAISGNRQSPLLAFFAFTFGVGTWTDVQLRCEGTAIQPWIGHGYMAFSQSARSDESTGGGGVVSSAHFYDLESLKQRVIVRFESRAGTGDAASVGDAPAIQVRLQGDRAIVFDRCGRVVVIALENGAIVREFHVS